jgi:hypothetical protein
MDVPRVDYNSIIAYAKQDQKEIGRPHCEAPSITDRWE